MTDKTYTCAVWYTNDQGQTDYELFEDEREAARNAVGLDGDGVVLGVQFADGRTVARAEWAAFIEEKQREEQRWRDRLADPPQPSETRLIRDPFEGGSVIVEASEPDWLGRRP